MAEPDLEWELHFAEQLAKQHRSWRNIATEYRRVVRPKTLSRGTKARGKTLVVQLPPPELDALVHALAVAVAPIQDGRHPLYMALAGALLSRGIPGPVVPRVVAGVARLAGDREVGRRVDDAASTVRAHQRGSPVTGFPTLRADWPTVATALDAHLPSAPLPSRQRVEQTLNARPSMPVYSLVAVQPWIRSIIASRIRFSTAVSVLSVPPGVGKSREAIRAAVGGGTKVAVLAPTNAVAASHYALAHQLDPRAVERRFGVLSVLRADGTPVCEMADVASVIQEASMPIRQCLCIYCQHRKNCTARISREGPRRARVLVANHALLDTALKHVGSTGTVIIDEMPSTARHFELSQEDIQTALATLGARRFARAFTAAVRPFVELVLAASFAAEGGDTLASSLHHAAGYLKTAPDFVANIAQARASFQWNEDADLFPFDQPKKGVVPAVTSSLVDECAELFRTGWARWHNHPGPPTTRQTARGLATADANLARDLAVTADVLAAFRAMTSMAAPTGIRPSATWCVEPHKAPWLAVTVPNPALVRCLAHPGPVLFLDATVDEIALRRMSTRPVDLFSCDVADASPVGRTLIASKRSAKKYLAPHSRVKWGDFGPQLCEALTVAEAVHGKNILVVAHKVCADALRKCAGGTVPHSRLAAILHARKQAGARTVIAHYGAVRGRNDFEDVGWEELDAVITVGDPWPDIGRIQRENAMLALSADEGEMRIEHFAAAELAQVHGRLRAPRRATPARSVHVGSVVPLGWTAANTTTAQLTEGRPPLPSSMTTAQLRTCVGLAGGNRALARLVGVGESTIRRYLEGRSIPAPVAERIQALTSDLGVPGRP